MSSYDIIPNYSNPTGPGRSQPSRLSSIIVFRGIPKKILRDHGKLKAVLNDSRVTGRPARRRARRIHGRPSSGPQIMLAAGELVLETIGSSGPISFRPRTSRARPPHNLKGEGAAHFVPAK